MKKAVRFALTVSAEIMFIVDDERSAYEEEQRQKREAAEAFWAAKCSADAEMERAFHNHVEMLKQRGHVTPADIEFVSDWGKDIFGVRPRWAESSLQGLIEG